MSAKHRCVKATAASACGALKALRRGQCGRVAAGEGGELVNQP